MTTNDSSMGRDFVSPLSTRLNIPMLPRDYLPRLTLLEALQHAPPYKLALVCAAAGYGKTTLAAAAAHRSGKTAWLSLSEAENHPRLFWRALVTAVQVTAPDFGAQTQRLLNAEDA
jgi:LuxR family transcriptional regulator, maltose regulon positive regulatory protein